MPHPLMPPPTISTGTGHPSDIPARIEPRLRIAFLPAVAGRTQHVMICSARRGDRASATFLVQGSMCQAGAAEFR